MSYWRSSFSYPTDVGASMGFFCLIINSLNHYHRYHNQNCRNHHLKLAALVVYLFHLFSYTLIISLLYLFYEFD
nr:MAG TPA: hypothetical protein [Bacteriophage sp.]